MLNAKPDDYRPHSTLEEALHTISHGLGAALAIVAIIFLVAKATANGGTKELVAASLYGASALVLYVCSTLYHGAYQSVFQPFLEALDHSAIYVKIAGSYTPFALLTLSPVSGTILLWTVWILAAIGITLKFVGHYFKRMRDYDWISVIGYLAMGWVGLFVIWELWQRLPTAGFLWLLAGGIAFTIGALFYRMKTVAYTHTIFHCFVLAGSVCHFVAIYAYVLPGRDTAI